MAFGDRTKKFQAERAAAEEAVTPEAGPVEAPTPAAPRWTMDELRAIVSAGMSVTEARALLEDGYPPTQVLELATLQAEQRRAAAAEAQTATAKAMQKAMKPENQEHPGISDFSYPEGDLKRPKPAPPFEFFYNGYPCHKFLETETWRECELMGQVRPGTFTVLRKDMSRMAVTVNGETNADGKLTKVSVEFPVSREDKWLVPPKTVVLYQLIHTDNPKRRFLEAMQEQLNLMVGEPRELASV